MKITVIGAGTVGSAVARDLCAQAMITQVQVCDARTSVLQSLKKNIDSPKLLTLPLDARDPYGLLPVFMGSACIVSCATPALNPILARLAISKGIHFCDLGEEEGVVEKMLSLHAKAQERGVWVVPNCGLAPGLVNILCMAGFEQFDTVHSIQVRVGDYSTEPCPASKLSYCIFSRQNPR